MSTGKVSSSGGLLVAAGAVRVRSADHHEALAEVAHVHLEGRHLTVREADPRHVHEHDTVVGGQRREFRREGLGHDGVDLLPLRLQRVHEFRGHDLVAREDEGPRLALDDGVRVGPVVLAEGVTGGLHDGPERVEAGLRGRHVEDDPGHPIEEVDPLGPDQRPVREQADGRRLRDRRADLGDGLDRFAQVRGGRGSEPLDEGLVGRSQPDEPGLDPDVTGRRQRGLCLTRAGRVIAVGEQHDAFLGVVGEERRGQSECGTDIGRRPHGGGRDAVDAVQVGRQPLHERLLAERDDARHVAIGDDLEGLAQERQRILPTGVADRVREVDHEDGRQPVHRQDQTEPGQGQHECAQQQRADDERRATPPDADPAARAKVEPDRQRHGRDQEEQSERGIERETHQAVPAPRPSRLATERRSRIRPSRW